MTSNAHVIASSSQLSHSSSGSNNIIGGHFKVQHKIGEGSFGVVFAGEDLRPQSRRPVAIKFEPRKSDAPQLRDEYRSYRTLRGMTGIPQVHYFGQEGLHNVLVIDLLGPNLEDLFDMCGRKFTIKTVCMLAKQMISRVQSVHDKSLIYRDIKPDNFLIGPPGSKFANTVYLIDFGMAKHYRDPKTKQHIPYRERKSLSGTARYMSINTHLGREQSRRDDLESLGHVFMYFLRGGLPWQGLKAATNKQKYEKIGEKKQSSPIDVLCEGFPEEFSIYMNYVRKLGFEEQPDYEFLRELFSKVLKGIHEVDDGVFDWTLLQNNKGLEYTTPRERQRENHRRASRPIDGAAPAPSPINATNGAPPLLVTPSPAQLKDRTRRAHRERDRTGDRDVSMSVQPIPPQSRQVSQHITGTTPMGSVIPTPVPTPTAHPYANAASATPSPIGNNVPQGMQMSGPYPRTTSNSPLPPIPGDAVAPSDVAQRGVNVVGSGTGLGALNAGMNGSRGELAAGGGSYGRAIGVQQQQQQQQQRGMGVNGSPPGTKARMSYDQNVGMTNGGVGAYEQARGMDGHGHGGERKKGFFAMLCCRA